jgi:putative ATPase
MEAFKFLGHPEGELALAQAAVYLATAPKSNSIYSAFSKTYEVINKTGSLPVPFHIRNAPTRLMQDLGYGKDYKYAHDYQNAVVAQEHMPEKLKGQQFYFPTGRGFEKTIKERLEKWRQLMRKSKAGKEKPG